MAPLSHDLSGLILPYDYYGTHLNSKCETIDTELEKKNFENAGETLAEVWSSTVVDSFPVVARYVAAYQIPETETTSPTMQRQIAKCNEV